MRRTCGNVKYGNKQSHDNRKHIIRDGAGHERCFGSVSHKQLRNNLKSLGLCKPIREVIMDSYNGATVKVITLNNSTEKITLKEA
jgi:hypothetical protein